MFIKKTCLVLLNVLSLSLAAQYYQRETARTYWIPWTTEHTRIWEIHEQHDTSVSHSRRNEFFEDMETLVQRDAHWITLYNQAYERLHATPIIPALGFAICDKSSGELIGTVRLFTTHRQGYLTLSYGLTPSARNHRFGSEIIQELMVLIKESHGTPIIRFTTLDAAHSFWDAWYPQGKQATPDFDHLISFFSLQTAPLRGITASVDTHNPASLAILLKNNMQPVEIECTQYYFSADASLRFGLDIKLMCPVSDITVHHSLQQLAHDIVSKNNDAIEAAYATLKRLFGIEDEWIYLLLTRTEKAALRLYQYTVTTARFSERISTTKRSYHGYRCPFA
jgi:RimJ/RimL family protein N-acetyltransferase